MKKLALLLSSGMLLGITQQSFAADLVSVYQDALKSDPTYQAAKTTYLSAMQDSPIARAAILPDINLTGGSSGLGYTSKDHEYGSTVTDNNNTVTEHGYGLGLTLSQPIFNYSYFMDYKSAKNTIKAAAATYYAAQQDLMVRTADAYFAVLEDEDNVRYTKANVAANKSSLDQAKQQYEVGLKTQTDVYTSQAAYSSAVSQDVSAQTTLEDDKENLRAITGKEYKSLAKLSDDFPLVSPDPASIDEWVKVATAHNWSLQSTHFTAMAGMDNVKSEFGGHLPTVTLDASYYHDYSYTNNHGSDSATGNEFSNDATVSLDFNVPVFSGGLVTAQTKQAEFDYQTDVHNMELEHRTVVTDTRQDYLGVKSGISAVAADKSSVQSNESALEGLKAGYKVGTQTMVDVLNQQELLFEAQQDYATDRYSYVTNLINLKNDAGILSSEDIIAINQWLGDAPAAKSKDKKHSLQTLADRFTSDGPVKPTVEITNNSASKSTADTTTEEKPAAKKKTSKDA